MRKAPSVILWAVAFAFVESAVVEYLRAIYYPLYQGGFRFPILTFEQIQSMGPEHVGRLAIEVGREFATLVMLAAIGLTAGSNRREAWAHFMIAFGVWDIFYYVWLKVFIDWPPGLMTWDLLFLIPVPWVAPVLAPVIISMALIASGLTVLWFEARRGPLVTFWRDWVVLVLGGITVIVSFCEDYRNIMNGGAPDSFNWKLFFTGFLIAAGGFVLLLFRQRRLQDRAI
ncbi:MAG: hypothetical protein HY913_15605 [Desulfomonile tiedjei]|nr:hypothetical protein [Desulfomonile tiedjei]